MRMNADGQIHYCLNRMDAVTHALRGQRTGGVRDVDDVRAILARHFCLLRKRFWRRHVAHHEEADRGKTEFFAQHNMLFARGDFGAVQCNAHDVEAFARRHAQIVHGAETRNQQRCELCVLQHFARALHHGAVALRRKAVLKDGTAKACAVADFRRIHAALFEARADVGDVLCRVLMEDRVAAVTQCGVDQTDTGFHFAHS